MGTITVFMTQTVYAHTKLHSYIGRMIFVIKVVGSNLTSKPSTEPNCIRVASPKTEFFTVLPPKVLQSVRLYCSTIL